MTRELILAAANNQINKVYECLIRGDNVNFKENLYGDTPLHKASICGHKSVVNCCYIIMLIQQYQIIKALQCTISTMVLIIDFWIDNLKNNKKNHWI